jgi:WD40 repeat protein
MFEREATDFIPVAGIVPKLGTLREERNVGNLRLLEAGELAEGHGGEVFACAYTADGAYVLSGGWDGHLRFWEVSSGSPVAALKVGPKPLSCCAVSPDGKQWLSGSMEGLLGLWDAATHEELISFVAHTRPISALCFSPDALLLATASWDRQIMLRKVGLEREGKTLSGHRDIVAGCRFTPDGKNLLSWSYDGTLRLWETTFGGEVGTLEGHADRVTAASVSPDGCLAVSGGRDGTVKLWDLQALSEVGSMNQSQELRGCFFLLDGESVVTVDAEGWMLLLSVPGFEVKAELGTGLKVQCGELAPSGMQIALGCEDGHVHFAAIEGLEDAPFIVTPTQGTKQTVSRFGFLFGKAKVTTTFRYHCPVCRKEYETDGALPSQPFSCGRCRQRLRLHSKPRQMQQQ